MQLMKIFHNLNVLYTEVKPHYHLVNLWRRNICYFSWKELYLCTDVFYLWNIFLFVGERTGFVQVGPKKWFFPSGYEREAANYYNFEFKPDDVIVLTFPRSGKWALLGRNILIYDGINDAQNNGFFRKSFVVMNTEAFAAGFSTFLRKIKACGSHQNSKHYIRHTHILRWILASTDTPAKYSLHQMKHFFIYQIRYQIYLDKIAASRSS